MKKHKPFRLLYKLPLLALLFIIISCSTDEEPVTQIQHVEEKEAQTPKQAVDESQEDTTVYTFAEQMPQFKGGEAEMMEFLGENVRYPEEAQEAGVEGIVVASFVVEKDGTLSDIQILKDLGMGTDEEVIRVIEKMSGQWVPGKQAGEPVRFRYTLPVRFTIK